MAQSSIRSTVAYPRPGWAEQDLERLWEELLTLGRKVTEERVGEEVRGLTFDAHMAGVVPVDEEGLPLRPAIIWLDERAAGLPRELWSGPLKLQGYSIPRLIKFLRVTGGAPSRTGKDVISKVVWLAENEPQVLSRARKLLDVKGFLLSRSTGAFVTGHDEASLTWMADTRRNRAAWSREILRKYGVREDLLPEIRNSTDVAGKLRAEVASRLGVREVPVFVGAGDLTAAAVGSGAVREGEVHVYLGTSDWVAAHSSKRRVDVFHYVGSILSAIPGRYLTVAEQEVAAGALEWVMRTLGVEDYGEVERMVSSVDRTALLFLPWLYGERSPVDDPNVRGGLINLTLDTERGEVLRAVMEGVALNVKWVFPYVERLVGRVREVNVIGGGALFDTWCQLLSSALKLRVKRLSDPQLAGVRGLAAIASVGMGVYPSFEDAVAKFKVDRKFEPGREAAELEAKFVLFREAYRKLRGTFRALNLGV
ncbi:carbohydrate kinase [Sulfodiicoccus acidiphilus]|uniref:Carbohydrate kinase n=1 Tax=Sulfodiicoccus acidiphilus TaxID=1670455 RepID=A0A348B5J7_9CREN|nr:carbohydrate kinase [Sulfodiicoccus acidiphilus]GGT93026.1 carbohydrate kinase [Sulfodiicoccus acidiphilus]